MKKSEFESKAEEWQLFIDLFKVCLKAVLLHSGNKKPSTAVLMLLGCWNEGNLQQHVPHTECNQI
jgi:hypothetical protein